MISTCLHRLQAAGATVLRPEPHHRGRLPWNLPAAHQELLARSDGIVACGGHLRLFGLRPSAHMSSMQRWNSPGLWRFAWPPATTRYVIIGDTGFGDQYAYRLEDLERDPAPVYALDNGLLEAERIADAFEAFLADVVEPAVTHVSPLTQQMLARFGPLETHAYLVQVPSPLITGAGFQPEAHIKMDATAAMIVNGDLACQLAGETFDRQIERLDPYQDEQGRGRMRVVWSGDGVNSVSLSGGRADGAVAAPAEPTEPAPMSDDEVLEFHEPGASDVERVQAAIEADDVDYLISGVVAIALYPSDYDVARAICSRLSTHHDEYVRGNAILGFGHLARIFGQVAPADRALVEQAFRDPSSHVRGHAHSALDDIQFFVDRVDG